MTNNTLVRDVLLLIRLLAIDLLTKYVFYNQWRGSQYYLLEPVLNGGISFSLPVSILVSVIITVVIIFVFVLLYVRKLIPSLTLVFLCAGAVWNLIDRICYGGVRDFLLIPQRFVFNVADILLTIGVVCLLRHEFWPHISETITQVKTKKKKTQKGTNKAVKKLEKKKSKKNPK